MKRRIQAPILWALLLGSLLSAAATPDAVAAEHVIVSYSQKVADYLPLWIADEAGYFKKHGLDVELRYLPAQQGVPALLTGQIQIMGIGGTDAASAQAQGTKLKLVLTFSPVNTFQFWAHPQ